MQLNLGTHSQECNENLDYSAEEQPTSGISSFVHEEYQNYGPELLSSEPHWMACNLLLVLVYMRCTNIYMPAALIWTQSWLQAQLVLHTKCPLVPFCWLGQWGPTIFWWTRVCSSCRSSLWPSVWVTPKRCETGIDYRRQGGNVQGSLGTPCTGLCPPGCSLALLQHL